jgi:hypothetical protein
MLPALLNTTVIWLGSLLVYELLLKRETFHRLNRFYLLLTFLAGICLPLLPWGDAVHFTVSSLAAQAPPSQATNVDGTSLQEIASPVESLPQKVNWLMLFYAGGVGVSSLYLLTDLFKLWRLFRRSRTHRKDGWIIAETGREQGPFSFLRILFVCRQTDYTSLQWQMLVQHETAHYSRKHIFDLALLQGAQILLWFHPLVYVYRNKLRLLHEYEVDGLQEESLETYGHFLLQQAVLPTTYSLTHTLNFSPLKKRIQMLTKNPSTRTAKWRFLMLLPLMSLFLLCCTHNKSKTAIDLKGEYAMRQDAALEYPKAMPADTFEIVDPVTGENTTIITQKDPVPISLNKQPIAKREELTSTPQCVTPGGNFGLEYLLEKAHLAPLLEELPDGNYYMGISEIIVDPSGKIATYRFNALPLPGDIPLGGQTGGVLPSTTISGEKGDVTIFKVKNIKPISNPMVIQEAAKLRMQKKLSEVLLGEEVTFTPAKNKKGVASPYFLDFENHTSGFLLGATFTVKAHQVSSQNYSL